METTYLSFFLVTLPVGIILYLGKEWIIAALSNTIHVPKEWRYNGVWDVISRIDILAFGVYILWGVSWGSLTQKNRKPVFIIFLLSQLWFIIVMIFCIFYYNLKNPEAGGYIDLFVKKLISGAWTLHLLNYIPIIPFDASFFYAKAPAMQILIWLSKGLFILLVITGFWNNDFINGIEFMNWFLKE